jgi:hypothetical protein
MKTVEEFKEGLKPFLEMVKTAKQTNNMEFLNNIQEFENLLILLNICGIKENPQYLDKFVDEIIEQV